MPDQTVQRPPRVPETDELAVTWALFGVALIFYCARIAVRLRIWRRLYIDDAWGTLALVLLLAMSVVFTLACPPMYALLHVGAGMQEPGPTFFADSSYYLKLQFALTMLFWSCLWAVKGCFLAFFYRLTTGVQYCRIAWWVTVVITVLSYAGCVLSYPLSCSSFVLGECEKPINLSRSLVSLRYSTAVDIITDAMIIALPLYLAFRVRLPLSQKLALAAVFSSGVLVMVFAVIRIILTNVSGEHPEVSWLNMWSQIEASIAVMISSVASFKALFTNRTKTKSSYEDRKYPVIPSGRSGLRNGGTRKSAPPSAIQLDERSKQYAVHEHGTIGMSAESGESAERILV